MAEPETCPWILDWGGYNASEEQLKLVGFGGRSTGSACPPENRILVDTIKSAPLWRVPESGDHCRYLALLSALSGVSEPRQRSLVCSRFLIILNTGSTLAGRGVALTAIHKVYLGVVLFVLRTGR